MSRRSNVLRIVRWSIFIGLAAALWYVTQRYTFPAVREEDDSMLPTLASGKRYLAEQLSWTEEPPEVGDVVVFLARLSEDEDPDVERHFARVAGVPGQRLQERDGHIGVDGRLYERHRWSPALHESPIPDGFYLLLNDNEMSVVSDSRRFGLVDRRAMIAIVFPHAELF